MNVCSVKYKDLAKNRSLHCALLHETNSTQDGSAVDELKIGLRWLANIGNRFSFLNFSCKTGLWSFLVWSRSAVWSF